MVDVLLDDWWQGNQLTALRGRGLEQLAHLRWLSVSHNLLADPWELTPLLALPAITWLAISPQRLPHDPLTCGSGGEASALYRRLVLLMTLHSRGSQRQAGLNFLDRPRGSHPAPLDAPDSSWVAVSIDQRVAALEELYMYVLQQRADAGASEMATQTRTCQQDSACKASDAPGRAQGVWAGAHGSWIEVRQHVLDRLARSAHRQIAAYSCLDSAPATATQAGDGSGSCRSSLASPAAEPRPAQPGQDLLWPSPRVQSRRTSGEAGEAKVAGWLEYERQRACLFASIGQRVALDASKLGQLRALSLAGCCLSHVRLHGFPSLISLDLRSNARLRWIEGLDALPSLQTALLERNPGLCCVDTLQDVMAQLMRLHSIHSITLPFHLLDARTDIELGAKYEDWQHLTVGC